MKGKNLARPAVSIAACLILTLTVVTIQRAYATGTVASAAKTTLSIPSGTDSVNINIAATNLPIQVITADIVPGYQAVTSATLVSIPANNPILMWNALSAYPTAIVSNWTNTTGTVMYNVGYSGTSQLVVGTTTANFHVHNGSPVTQTIIVTQIW